MYIILTNDKYTCLCLPSHDDCIGFFAITSIGKVNKFSQATIFNSKAAALEAIEKHGNWNVRYDVMKIEVSESFVESKTKTVKR